MSGAPAPITLVLGASTHADRYSNRAILHLLAYGHAVIAVGKSGGEVAGVTIQTEWPVGTVIDTVTIYLNRANQAMWEERITAARPHRVIFNPGAENAALAERLRAAGAHVESACTLVMLATGQY